MEIELTRTNCFESVATLFMLLLTRFAGCGVSRHSELSLDDVTPLLTSLDDDVRGSDMVRIEGPKLFTMKLNRHQL